MKNTICLSLILLSGWASASSVVEPKIIPVKNDVGIVELGYSVNEAIRNSNKDFRLLEVPQFIPSVKDMFIESANETPMASVADFNGDGVNDVVVMGQANKELLVLAVLSNANGYIVKTVSRQVWSNPETTYYPPMVYDSAESNESEGEILRQKGLFQYLAIVPPGDDIASGMLKADYKIAVAAFSLETYFSGTNPVFFVKPKTDTLCEVTGTQIVNKKRTLKTTCSDKKR